MAVIKCLNCGEHTPANRSGRCDSCRRAKVRQAEANPARRARKSSLYGPTHRQARANWAPHVESGRVTCWRCGIRIEAGSQWDLGHRENAVSLPEHAECNRRAGGQARQAYLGKATSLTAVFAGAVTLVLGVIG